MVAPAHAIRFWALEARRFRPTERMKGNAEVITVETRRFHSEPRSMCEIGIFRQQSPRFPKTANRELNKTPLYLL
jgi:hypothetical protein